MRNEGPFILEWVAYHRSIGFTDIVVCTNDCVDGSPDLLDRLQALGLLTHLAHTVATGEKAQLAAYRRAEALPVVRDADWAMVLDGDEFLNIHVGDGTVPELIDAVPEATAFLINWRLFGHSGHDRWSPDFVAERFTRAALPDDPVNLSFKTLFTKIDAYGCKLMPHQPLFADKDRMAELVTVDGAGRRLPERFAAAEGFLQSEPGTVSFALAQVNHYNTRSREDYLVKHHRGGGLDIAWDLEESWRVFNKNDVVDRSIANKLARMKAIYAALLEDAELGRLHERCRTLYRAHIAALRRGNKINDA